MLSLSKDVEVGMQRPVLNELLSSRRKPMGAKLRSLALETLSIVIPAKAGIQGQLLRRLPWTPAFAGVTIERKRDGNRNFVLILAPMGDSRDP
jgi:hypothetical protein